MFKKYGVEVCSDSVRTWVACTDFDEIRAYLFDIGINIQTDLLNINAEITTINSNSDWILAKLEMVVKYFLGDLNDDNQSGTMALQSKPNNE